jgi:pimeloyl-ACP methyl ester carboxylesterase
MLPPTEGLAYTDSGGDGRPVVLLHGLTCHLGYWLRVAPLLGGLRVIAVDLRGHGLSAHRDSYRYADYEADLVALLDGLDLDRAVVAGHSLGGYVALRAAAGNHRIAGVLAADVKSDWTEEDAELARRAKTAEQRIESSREALLDRLARGLAPAALDGEELLELAERALEAAEGGWRFRWDRRVLATEPVAPFTFLGKVRCPVGVLAGAESPVMPPGAARLFAAAIPGATLELLDGAGHHVELEAPEAVAERIRLLATG